MVGGNLSPRLEESLIDSWHLAVMITSRTRFGFFLARFSFSDQGVFDVFAFALIHFLALPGRSAVPVEEVTSARS